MARDIFDMERLAPPLDSYLRDTNPWWVGKPGRVIPEFHRWAFYTLKRKLESGLAPAILLRGPRQVGKTTLQEQIIRDLIEKEDVNPRRILRVQFDEIPSIRDLKEPVLSIARWFENRILETSFNESAHRREVAYLFFDEVQNLRDWAPQLKALVDHNTVKVVITGSSALRIEAGKDSLAGRVNPLDLGTLLLREIAGLRYGETLKPLLPNNGLGDLLRQEFWKEVSTHGEANVQLRDRAFAVFSERGGYPIAHAKPELPWPEVADQLNETVIRRVILHDLRLGRKGQKRDKNLLEEVFRLACRYAGQAPSQAVYVQQIKDALQANVGWGRILSYLKFLDGALLLKLVQPLEIRLKKRKGNLKLCISDHGLRASWLEEVIPLDAGALDRSPHLADLAGHIAESVVGHFLSGLPNLDLSHFAQRPTEPEVDYVMTIGDKRIPLGVKYRQRIDEYTDTVGLRAFLEKTSYNAPFGILVTLRDSVPISDPRIVSVSLPSLLLIR
jgi:predicted AAA+ superfamily ATPase